MMNIFSNFRQTVYRLMLPVLTSISLLTLSSCGSSVPVPTEALAVAEAAVERANTTATREHAGGELQQAIAKLASARDAVNNRENTRALQLAQQAELDALVAESRAQAIRATVAAREAQEANRALREEINR